MTQRKLLGVFRGLLFVLIISFSAYQIEYAGQNQSKKSGSSIHIDIPVNLKKANVVFNMDHLAFAGDARAGIKYMHMLADRYK